MDGATGLDDTLHFVVEARGLVFGEFSYLFLSVDEDGTGVASVGDKHSPPFKKDCTTGRP